MLTLGLNTSGASTDVAIVRDGEILAQTQLGQSRGQDARLPGLVRSVCAAAGTSLSDIQRIGVVTGPGSFTGVRIGVAFARGLSLALEIPSLGISSLEAALPAGQQGSAIVIFPAQKRAPDITFWMQRFRTGMATTPPEEIRLEKIEALLEKHPHIVFGEAGALTQTCPGLEVHASMASAARAAELAASYSPEDHPPKPIYVRPPDALLPGGQPAP